MLNREASDDPGHNRPFTRNLLCGSMRAGHPVFTCSGHLETFVTLFRHTSAQTCLRGSMHRLPVCPAQSRRLLETSLSGVPA